MNYENGKIYMIRPMVDHDENEVYIGSTTKYYLSDRLAKHRETYEKYKVGYGCGRYAVYDIFDKYGSHNCQIYLLETVNAKSKDELFAREGYHIRNTKCLNKVNPSGQTREEYLEKKRQYRIDNKDKIQEYVDMRKEKVNCECGGSYTLNNKTHHLKTKKHILFLKMDLEKMV
jgi:hypothetical protein